LKIKKKQKSAWSEGTRRISIWRRGYHQTPEYFKDYLHQILENW
jgi:hypothetical protein